LLNLGIGETQDLLRALSPGGSVETRRIRGVSRVLIIGRCVWLSIRYFCVTQQTPVQEGVKK